jgi:hypothetical protein
MFEWTIRRAAKRTGPAVRGTLDMVILKTLITDDVLGHSVERTSEDVLEVEQGSLDVSSPLMTHTSRSGDGRRA